MVANVFFTPEDTDIPSNAEIVHALATACFGHARALAIERILLGIGTGSADDADIVALGIGYSLGGFEPDAGSSLSLGRKRGDITLGALIEAADFCLDAFGIVLPLLGGGFGLATIHAVHLTGLIPGKGQQTLPEAHVFLYLCQSISHCRSSPFWFQFYPW